MGWRDALSNAVTLGGHQKLQTAKAEYEDTHSRYLLKFDSEKAYRARLEKTVQELGALTIAAFKALKVASRIAKRTTTAARVSAYQVYKPTLPDFERVQRLEVNFSQTKSALGGAGTGSAALIGSWSVVSLVGAASTGTAISALSGVAATNATLAWFGGGALVAGGAGMAGGTAVLGGVALLPVMGFMSWHSHAKAEQVVLETKHLRFQLQELGRSIDDHTVRILAANAAMSRLQSPAEALMAATILAKRQFFPVPLVSMYFRKIRSWFGGDFYREHEARQLDELHSAILRFEAVWHPTVEHNNRIDR